MAKKKDENGELNYANELKEAVPSAFESPVKERNSKVAEDDKKKRMAKERTANNVLPREPVDRTLHETVRSMAGGQELMEADFYNVFRKAIVNIYQNEGPDKISEKEIMLLQALSIQNVCRKIESLDLDGIVNSIGNVDDSLGDITLILDKKLKSK